MKTKSNYEFLQTSEEQLNDFRKKIDLLNIKLISTLSERFEITQEVGKLKNKYNLSYTDQCREDEMIAKLIIEGKKNGLNENFIKEIFKLIIKESKMGYKNNF